MPDRGGESLYSCQFTTCRLLPKRAPTSGRREMFKVRCRTRVRYRTRVRAERARVAATTHNCWRQAPGSAAAAGIRTAPPLSATHNFASRRQLGCRTAGGRQLGSTSCYVDEGGGHRQPSCRREAKLCVVAESFLRFLLRCTSCANNCVERRRVDALWQPTRMSEPHAAAVRVA